MSLNKYKDLTQEICIKKGWDEVSIEVIWMLLTEEIGELASAIRRTSRHFQDKKIINVEGEIMDVLSYLFQLAYKFNIDLDQAWSSHVNASLPRK